MAGGNYNFSRTLNTDLGKLMFTSIPHLIILFSIILFIQTNYLYFIDETSHGKGPLFVSLFLSIIFLFIFVYIKIKSIDKYSSLFMFTVLAVFFLTEFFLLEYSSISYLWIFLLLTQILSSYFLLSRKYYLLMMGLIFCVYLLNFLLHSGDEFKMEPLLVIFFTYLISFVFHHDRRKSFINLEKICRSQNEINSRFLQLEENINQIFILCSYDFTEYYYISSGFERMFEISKDLFISRPDAWMDFSHAGDRERVKMELEIARKDRLRREFDFRTDYMNIESKWLKIQIFPIDVTDPSLKDRCAIIIDNITENKMAELKLAEARSLDAEFAARIQKNLLFSNPDLKIQSLEVAAESIPSLSVGGDFFDFYRYSDFIVDVIIADVMGKGMIASMLGAASKSAFMKSRLDLSVLENDIPSINKIMTLTNQTLSPELIKMGKFITMQYGRLNMKTSLFSFIDSGHTSLLYYSARQKCCWSLKGWNMPLGFNPREDLISSIIPFERNDLFFFYSDGVTETANDEGELFGEKRLNYVINSSAHLTSSQIMNKVRNLVFHYSSAEGFADDVTCIAMKIGGIEQNFSRTETIFPGIRESLSDIRKYVTDFFHKNFKNLDDDLIHSIVLAVNEGAANIIEHNYEKHPERNGREILIETGYNSSVCFFKLFYDGEDFEWTIFEAPELNELKSGGYGLFLMKEIMDSISYSTNIYGVQCLSLLKYLPLP